MEAVKLGAATVGLKCKTHAVLIALKRASSELSSYQKKIFTIDDHLGISIAGITADARVLSRYLRQECLNYKFAYADTYPVQRLITKLGNKMQVCTQRYDRRPYGVGLLVAGCDVSQHYKNFCKTNEIIKNYYIFLFRTMDLIFIKYAQVLTFLIVRRCRLDAGHKVPVHI